MATKLFQRVYTSYEDAKFIDSQRQPWICISDEESEKAEEFMEKNDNKLVSYFCPIAHYLIDGNVIMEQDAKSADKNKGWCYKVFSETEKGLKDITRKMGLPLK